MSSLKSKNITTTDKNLIVPGKSAEGYNIDDSIENSRESGVTVVKDEITHSF